MIRHGILIAFSSTIDRGQAGIPVSLVSVDFLAQQECMVMLACIGLFEIKIT